VTKMARRLAVTAVTAGLLMVSCAGGDVGTGEEQGSVLPDEAIAVRSQVADIWRDASSTQRERACLGYVAGEFLDGGSGSDPEAVGDQLAEGSLAGFDQEIVAEEWGSLLESVCSDTREDFAAAEEALSPGGEGCQIEFIVRPEQTLENLITAASCEVVRGRAGGREVRVSLCIPESEDTTGNFDIGEANSGDPYSATYPRSEEGLRAGCPRSTVSPTLRVALWTFVIPLSVDRPLLVLTGKKLQKEYLQFSLDFTE